LNHLLSSPPFSSFRHHRIFPFPHLFSCLSFIFARLFLCKTTVRLVENWYLRLEGCSSACPYLAAPLLPLMGRFGFQFVSGTPTVSELGNVLCFFPPRSRSGSYPSRPFFHGQCIPQAVPSSFGRFSLKIHAPTGV